MFHCNEVHWKDCEEEGKEEEREDDDIQEEERMEDDKEGEMKQFEEELRRGGLDEDIIRIMLETKTQQR